MKKTYSLMIHGGAGSVANKTSSLESIKKIVEKGEAMLRKGASSLDVVEKCVMLLENDPQFNAGRGSVLTHEGKVELDASIMNGSDLRAGAVAGVVGIKNPVTLAREVMDKSEFVFLVGKGAEKFALANNIAFEKPPYFITPQRKEQLMNTKKSNHMTLDHTIKDRKFGTVGAVALDLKGNLAAATSTGGLVNKNYGRVGDSPIIGAGCYADNETCAVSCTGYGEHFIRMVMAKTVSDIILYKKVSAQTASELAIKMLINKVKGLGGVIVVDKYGKIGKAYSTEGMIWGSVVKGGEVKAMLG
ncbi:isoaspartyl peptidase/L-asparaginase [Candidatus Falkowbacteria bacterium]|nr:isoaspartyl peptidase/L-asparaginase [Candidatus Falkowbacteria bacterium]